MVGVGWGVVPGPGSRVCRWQEKAYLEYRFACLTLSSEGYLASIQSFFLFGGLHPTGFYEINSQYPEGEGSLFDLVEMILELVVILASAH